MAAWLRVLANPKILKHTWAIVSNPSVLGRFVRTPAGRRAAFKYGAMLVNSRSVRNAIKRFNDKSGAMLQGSPEYNKLLQQYNQLQERVAELESQLKSMRENDAAMSTRTFTLGRSVVEMRRLYANMQTLLNQFRNNQMAKMATSRSR